MDSEEVIAHFIQNTTPEERICTEAAERKALFERLSGDAAERAQRLLDDAKALLSLHIIYENIAAEVEVLC